MADFNGGSVNYNWSHQTLADTAVINSSLAQHLVSAHADLTLIDRLPIRVSYFGRETNSPHFRNYHDLRLELDVQHLQRLNWQKAAGHLRKQIQEELDSSVHLKWQNSLRQYLDSKQLLENPETVRKLIQSKETLLRENFKDTSVLYKDSIHFKAKQFVRYYDSLESLKNRNRAIRDSFQLINQKYKEAIREIDRAGELSDFNLPKLDALSKRCGFNGIGVSEFSHFLGGIKKVSIGRTFPQYSSLTLQNVSVNGINAEYEQKSFFIATAIGSVDFRLRDFLLGKDAKSQSQHVWLVKFGYGNRRRSFVAASYFQGKKQLISSELSPSPVSVAGVSLEGRIFVSKHTQFFGEIAQSATPLPNNDNLGKPKFHLDDNSHQAYTIGLHEYLPSTQTKLEGLYQKTGINYHCFNSFQYNATLSGWSAMIEQPLWKRQIRITASVRKNDFSNPYLLQRYNANTVFKTALLHFQKAKWPSLTVGYLPSSQNIIVGYQLYENRFQTFTGTLNHQYSIGAAKGVTSVVFSQFFNEVDDSALVYFNSKNLYGSQTFLFDLFTANVGFSFMKSSEYTLTVLEAGLSTTVLKKIQLDVGVKVNHLKSSPARFGFKGGTRLSLGRVGELSIWTEKSFMPSTLNNLQKYEIYNLGFSRFFR